MSHSKKEMLSFFMTTKCNLNCNYCYTNKSHFGHQTIDLEFAKLGVEDFFEHNNSRLIRFFGAGEPTTESELMGKIKDYAYEKAGSDLEIEIQTNGCFSSGVRDWLAENCDIIWLSWDGPPEIQNFYRPLLSGAPSSEIIESNAKYLIENGNGMTGVRATIGSLNLCRQNEMIKYFSDSGIKYIWSDPIFFAI